jgi:hypothetical protein
MGLYHKSDYALHLPGGSSVPGKIDANIYMQMPPKELRLLIEKEQDPEEKKKMVSALKQFERLYDGWGYPWRGQCAKRVLLSYRQRCAELVNPAINIPYYQDSEFPSQGQEEIIDGLKGLYDNDNAEKENYSRQGIRPIRDIDTGKGDFLSPTESPVGPVVKERGDGPDPDGLDYTDPPTGGDNYDDVYKS